MAKVSTTLQNIEYIQEQREKREITQQEQRAIDNAYNSLLDNTIKYTFMDIFDESDNIEERYNDFILNNKQYINKIYKIVDEESQKHYKIITNYTWKKGDEDYTRTKEKVYYFDSYDIEHDIFTRYFDILDKIYKLYKKEESAKENAIIKKLENYFTINYVEHEYKSCNTFFYEYKNIFRVIDEITQNKQEQKMIRKNYYKTLDKIDKQFKKGQKKEEQQKKNYSGAIIFGAGLYGLAKGFKNASK